MYMLLGRDGREHSLPLRGRIFDLHRRVGNDGLCVPGSRFTARPDLKGVPGGTGLASGLGRFWGVAGPSPTGSVFISIFLVCALVYFRSTTGVTCSLWSPDQRC